MLNLNRLSLNLRKFSKFLFSCHSRKIFLLHLFAVIVQINFSACQCKLAQGFSALQGISNIQCVSIYVYMLLFCAIFTMHGNKKAKVLGLFSSPFRSMMKNENESSFGLNCVIYASVAFPATRFIITFALIFDLMKNISSFAESKFDAFMLIFFFNISV